MHTPHNMMSPSRWLHVHCSCQVDNFRFSKIQISSFVFYRAGQLLSVYFLNYVWSFDLFSLTIIFPACNRMIEGSFGIEGQISAPNFPSSYPRENSFYTCTYTLRNRNLANLRLVFNDFHLDDDIAGGFKNGTRDYLQVSGRGQTFIQTYKQKVGSLKETEFVQVMLQVTVRFYLDD